MRICGIIIAEMPGSDSSNALVPQLLGRHLRAKVQAALADTRVVVILGARQVGKSTLVQQIAAGEPGRLVITLDEEARRRGALEDPTGFVADLRTPVPRAGVRSRYRSVVAGAGRQYAVLDAERPAFLRAAELITVTE